MDQNVQEIVANITKNTADPSVRESRGMVPGEVIHQGDVYLFMVEQHSDVYKYHKSLKAVDNVGEITSNMQLAPGTTKGSRHILKGEGLTVYNPPEGCSALEGPYFEATEDFVLTHPEHADHLLGPGKYVCIYQRDWAAEEMRRVMD